MAPLGVLFGMNAFDELDRTAFAVLLPDIRDRLGMSDEAALRLVALSAVAVLVVEVPLSFACDRRNRVRIAAAGAAIWALFSFGTGLAVAAATVAGLVVARIGAGIGRAVVNPSHLSLLSDWYEPAARVKVFSVHRQANNVGQALGPLVGGVVAQQAGLAWPFYLFAVPTMVFVLLALRLREPVRGGHEGAPTDRPESVRSTFRVLGRVRTIRRIWMAAPFLGVVLLGVPSLLALVYEDVFGLGSAARGAIAAGVEPLQVVGVLVAMPYVANVALRDPAFLLRFVAVVGVVDGALLVALANAPNVAVAVVLHALLATSIGTLAPAFFALVSLVAPPRVRATSFSTISIFAVPGIVVLLPLIGTASDRLGTQASMLVFVPVAVAAGLVLASAAPFVAADIAAGAARAPSEGGSDDGQGGQVRQEVVAVTEGRPGVPVPTDLQRDP